MTGGTTIVVLGGGIFIVDGTIGNFFPILETVPLVDDGTCVGKCPPDVETIREVEMDGDFLLGEGF